MKNRFIFFLAILLLYSCKKDELEGDHLLLEGKWKWAHSNLIYNDGMPNSSSELVPSNSISGDYFLEFDRKGKVMFYKNETVEEKYRIVINKFMESPACIYINCYAFSIYLNNKSDHRLAGSMNEDTMLVFESNIPLKNHSESGTTYTYQHLYLKYN